jgi:hypothetical protein
VNGLLEAGEVRFQGRENTGEEEWEEAYKGENLVWSVEGFGLWAVLVWGF